MLFANEYIGPDNDGIMESSHEKLMIMDNDMHTNRLTGLEVKMDKESKTQQADSVKNEESKTEMHVHKNTSNNTIAFNIDDILFSILQFCNVKEYLSFSVAIQQFTKKLTPKNQLKIQTNNNIKKIKIATMTIITRISSEQIDTGQISVKNFPRLTPKMVHIAQVSLYRGFIQIMYFFQ